MSVQTHASIFQQIVRERSRQEALMEKGRFAWTCSDPEISNELRLGVLCEEVGEVARAVLGCCGVVADGGDLERELVQVAAVAVAWLEAIA